MNGHVLEQLSAYLDGELGREEHAAVQGHVKVCAACAQRLEELAALDDVARALPADAPAGYFEELPARVRARLEARQRVPRWPVWSWAAAAVLLLAVLTPAVLRRDAAPADAPARVPPPAAPPAEESLDLLERKQDDSVKRRQAPPEAQKPVAAPAATPPPSVGAFRDAVPELRKQAREEGVVGYAQAPPAKAPAAPGPRTTPAAPPASAPVPAERPTPLAHVVPEQDEALRADADASGERARDAERPRPETTDSVAQRRMTTGAAGKLSEPQSAVDARYGRLLASATPTDAAAARALRDAWRAYVRDNPTHAGADEARVRALEAGAAAYRMGGDPRDLEGVRADAEAYLARPDAAQPDRVRALLRRLEQ